MPSLDRTTAQVQRMPRLDLPAHPRPVRDDYFADPFLTRFNGQYYAYGTTRPRDGHILTFEAIRSDDLVHWTSLGQALTPLDTVFGDAYWAPEVVERDGRYWMYYSVGRGIDRHHIRVAAADTPEGPFVDCGVDLTPQESFAIDAHPFRDDDGQWYLFFARDVLEGARPGTHLAVTRLPEPTVVGAKARPVLAPDADWQIYERGREIYGRRFDWHTLEGPTVTRHGSDYYLFFSAGSWEGAGYGVSVATAPHPFGPWNHRAESGASFMSSSSTRLAGPGHNSVMHGERTILTAFHAWNSERTARQMYIAPVLFD
ncbi:glycoside hydrolase family 43 protein [Humibacter ginsenosidimutans]|nr:glycoside hydrolase family 43 protein [Humibacter ginsenosidimutans]